MKINNKDDFSIGVIVSVNDRDKDKSIGDSLVTLKRSFKQAINVYVFSNIADAFKRREFRTICNSLQSEDFNIILIEQEFDFNMEYQSKIIAEKFIILIKRSIFFLIDDWYEEMINHMVVLGQRFYTLGPYVSMFKKEDWLTAANQNFNGVGKTADAHRVYLVRD
jgi:hypothetical protein